MGFLRKRKIIIAECKIASGSVVDTHVFQITCVRSKENAMFELYSMKDSFH